MGWFLIVVLIFSAVLYALSSFIDNYITDAIFRGRRPEAQKVLNIGFYGIVIIALLIFSPPSGFSPLYFFLLLAVGASDAIASIFYYRALAREETTGVTILNQFLPVFSLIAGFFILGDEISITQLIAIALLLSAAIFIIFSHGKSKSRTRIQLKTASLLLVAMLFWTTATTLFAFSGGEFEFTTSFFYVMLGHLISNTIMTIIMKSWRTRAKNVFREFRWKFVGAYFGGAFIWLAGEALWSFAILSVPIAIASAVNSTAQLIATFLLGLAFTIIWPRFGRERLTRRTVSYHLIALVLSIAAILLIQLA